MDLRKREKETFLNKTKDGSDELPIRYTINIGSEIRLTGRNKNGTKEDITKGRMEPLGYLPEIDGLLKMGMQKVDEIYEDVLMDTEVGCYFFAFLEKELKNAAL